MRPSVPERTAHLGRRAGCVVGPALGLVELPSPRRGARARPRARRRPARACRRVRAATPAPAGRARARSPGRMRAGRPASPRARPPARPRASATRGRLPRSARRRPRSRRPGMRRGSARRSPPRSRPARSRPPPRGSRRRAGASPSGRGARASRRRPAGRAPGGSRTARARASADRTRARAPPCGRGPRAAASSPLRSIPESAARPRMREGLAEHGRVAEQPPLLRVEPVEPCGDQCLQRLGDIEGVDRADRPVLVAVRARAARGRAASARSRPRRAGCRRRGRGSARGPRRAGRGRARCSIASIASPGSGSRNSELKRRVLEPQPACRSASSGRASVITKIGRFRDHSSRYSTNSTSAESAHWMSSKSRTTGPCFGHPLEEHPPAGEQILAVGCAAVGQAEQLLQPRLDEGALLRIGDELLDHCGELRAARCRPARPR